MIEKNEFKAKDGVSIYLAAIFSLLFFQILFTMIFSAANPESGSSAEYVLSYAASVCFQIGYLAVFAVYLTRRRTRPQIFFKSKIKPVFYIAAVVAPFACFLFFYPASYAFDVFLNFLKYPSTPLAETDGVLENVLLVLATVVLAPVCEELIYRSALVSGLSKKFSSDSKGVLICVVLGGAVFSLMHMSPRQTVFQFFLGCAAVILVLTSGSVIPSIILHFINNLVVVLAHYFKVFEAPFDFMEDLLLSSTLTMIVSAVLFTAAGIAVFIGLWLFLKRHSELSVQNACDDGIVDINVKSQSKSFYTSLLLGMGICVGMWLAQFATGILS